MNPYLIEVFHVKYRVDLSSSRYVLNREQPILEIFDANSGMPAGRLTLCIPSTSALKANETVLRLDFCQDIIDQLERSGIASRTDKSIFQGYSKFPIVRLTDSFLEQQAKISKV